MIGAATLAALGFLDADQGLTASFWTGMLLVITGVVIVQMVAVRTAGKLRNQ